jgi:glycosyltransferase involved in cell wall biosynthesis
MPVEFSVVIPAFNAADTIVSAIRSVLRQSAQEFEIVVVDDGSSDGTAERAAEVSGDSRLRVLRQQNRGPSAARNAGIEAANGRFVSFLDADDLWLPDYLATMGAALNAVDEAGFAFTDAWLLDARTHRIRRATAMHYMRPVDPPDDPRALHLLLLDRNFVFTGVTARRSALVDVGGFDETLWIGEDWDLWLRLARHGYRAVRVPGVLAIYRASPSSLSRDTARMVRSTCEIYRRLAGDTDLDEERRAFAARKLEEKTAALARLESPRRFARVSQTARVVKRWALRRRVWLSRRPEEVERTLAAVEDGAAG